jgi:multiple sugar transport system permease protein
VTVPLIDLDRLLISVGLNSIKWFQKFLQTVFFLPYVTNAIAVGMVFSVLFDKQGVINYLFHTDITWIYGATALDRDDSALHLHRLVELAVQNPDLLIGLQGIDKQYYQAAKHRCGPLLESSLEDHRSADVASDSLHHHHLLYRRL